jgi:hypothetical protein
MKYDLNRGKKGWLYFYIIEIPCVSKHFLVLEKKIVAYTKIENVSWHKQQKCI